MIFQKAQEFQPVDVGHIDVGKNDVELLLGKHLERFEAAGNFHRLNSREPWRATR